MNCETLAIFFFDLAAAFLNDPIFTFLAYRAIVVPLEIFPRNEKPGQPSAPFAIPVGQALGAILAISQNVLSHRLFFS